MAATPEPASSRASPHRSRAGSPFGKSRQATPRASGRRPGEKSATPSPLDLGYQTLEHSYDGESSLSSDTQRAAERLEAVPASGVSNLSYSVPLLSLLSLPDTLITRLLSHLSSTDLVRLSSTCRRLARLAWQPELWTNILLADERLDVDRAIRSILARLVWGPRAGGC